VVLCSPEVHQHSGAVEPKTALRLTLFRPGLNGWNSGGDQVLCWNKAFAPRDFCNLVLQLANSVPMSAFRQSVEAMIPALRRYARALARDADIADDLVQDTLVRALRSERLFLGGDVRSWLYTILTNLNKNRRRSLARRPQFMPLSDNNPDASGTEAEGRDIARALATLVEEQRSVLLLVMLEGLSYREVADIQGVPIGTVMSRLARARAHVRASLEGERTTLRRVK
jgi:RNA polymerase sigma factor (sigma-70 family)